MKNKIITYPRKVRRVSKSFKELRYFMNGAGYSKDKNNWEPMEGLANAGEQVEKFNRENPGMPGLKGVE